MYTNIYTHMAIHSFPSLQYPHHAHMQWWWWWLRTTCARCSCALCARAYASAKQAAEHSVSLSWCIA